MLNALLSDWSEYLEKPATNENIKKSMRKVKIYFIVWFVVTLLIMLVGIGMINGSNSIEGRLTGLFVAMAGLCSNCLMKLWVHIKTSSYKILWEMNNRFEGNIQRELRRSEAQDL